MRELNYHRNYSRNSSRRNRAFFAQKKTRKKPILCSTADVRLRDSGVETESRGCRGDRLSRLWRCGLPIRTPYLSAFKTASIKALALLESKARWVIRQRFEQPNHKQKHDRRDADALLSFLIEERFLGDLVTYERTVDLRAFLRYRHPGVGLRIKIQVRCRPSPWRMASDEVLLRGPNSSRSRLTGNGRNWTARPVRSWSLRRSPPFMRTWCVIHSGER